MLKVKSLGLASMVVMLGMYSGSASAQSTFVMDDAMKGEIEKVVKETFKNDPGYFMNLMNDHIMEEQAKAEQEEADKMKVEVVKTEGKPFVGAEKPVMEVVYFFDVNCVYCKSIEPVLKKFYTDNKDVRLSFREIPILSQTSNTAAMVGHVVWQMFPEKYPELHSLFMETEGAISDEQIALKVKQVLGVKDADKVFAAVADEKSPVMVKAQDIIKENLDTSREVGITGTPFLYIANTNTAIRGAVPTLADDLNNTLKNLKASK